MDKFDAKAFYFTVSEHLPIAQDDPNEQATHKGMYLGIPVSVCEELRNLGVQIPVLSNQQHFVLKPIKMGSPTPVENVTRTQGINAQEKVDIEDHQLQQPLSCDFQCEQSFDEELLSKEIEEILTSSSEKDCPKEKSSRELHSSLSTPLVQIHTPSNFEALPSNMTDEESFLSLFEFPEHGLKQDKTTPDLSDDRNVLPDIEASLEKTEQSTMHPNYSTQISNDSGFIELDSEEMEVDLYCYEAMPDSPALNNFSLSVKNTTKPVAQQTVNPNEKILFPESPKNSNTRSLKQPITDNKTADSEKEFLILKTYTSALGTNPKDFFIKVYRKAYEDELERTG